MTLINAAKWFYCWPMSIINHNSADIMQIAIPQQENDHYIDDPANLLAQRRVDSEFSFKRLKCAIQHAFDTVMQQIGAGEEANIQKEIGRLNNGQE